MTTKTILTPSLLQFSYDLQQAVKEGFVIDDQNPPAMFGTYYECVMTKDEDDLLTFENIPLKRGPKTKITQAT